MLIPPRGPHEQAKELSFTYFFHSLNFGITQAVSDLSYSQIDPQPQPKEGLMWPRARRSTSSYP